VIAGGGGVGGIPTAGGGGGGVVGSAISGGGSSCGGGGVGTNCVATLATCHLPSNICKMKSSTFRHINTNAYIHVHLHPSQIPSHFIPMTLNALYTQPNNIALPNSSEFTAP
jgi:hypothetical protein